MGVSTLIALPIMIVGRYLAGANPIKILVILVVSLLINFLVFALGVFLFTAVMARQEGARKTRKVVAMFVYSLVIMGVVTAQYSFFRNTQT
jgi:hypothetical protein